MSLFHTPSVWSTVPNIMWNSRCSVLNPSDKHCSYIKPPYMHTHKHVSNQSTVKGQKGQKKTRGCTSIDSLLLCLHSNLALPRNLHGERNGLAYNDPFALTNDPTGHAPLGSFARVSHTSRKHEIHHPRLSHYPCKPLRSTTARDRTNAHLWLPKLRVWCCQEDIGHQGELAASTKLKGEIHDIAVPVPRDLMGGKDQHLPCSC